MKNRHSRLGVVWNLWDIPQRLMDDRDVPKFESHFWSQGTHPNKMVGDSFPLYSQYIPNMVGHVGHRSHCCCKDHHFPLLRLSGFHKKTPARKPSLILGRCRAAWQICQKSQYRRCRDVMRSKKKAPQTAAQGLLNVPFWVYWTSPYSSHYRPYT